MIRKAQLIPCFPKNGENAFQSFWEISSNPRAENEAMRDRAEAFTSRDRERAARADQLHAPAVRARALWPLPISLRWRSCSCSPLMRL